MDQILILRDNAKAQLMEIKTIEGGMDYLNKVKAIETWAKAEKKDAELQNIVAEQKIRTQRVLGQMIKDGQEAGEIRKPNEPNSKYVPDGNIPKTLDEVGITRKESSTFKTIAEIPEQLFEETITEKKEAVNKAVSELTTAGMVKVAKIHKRQDDIQAQREEIKSNPDTLSGLYDVISIDPPWSYGREFDPENSRVANPYPEMSQEQLKSIEIPKKDSGIILLWTTHAFIQDAFELLEHWGYDYKATIVWNKEKMGMGAWVRMQCEFCLLGINGKPFWNNTKWRDIITEPRREHSRKPEIFYKMIEDITEGNRLDYFSRDTREGWDSFGNDKNKFSELGG